MTGATDPIAAELQNVERQLVDWKRRAKTYGEQGMSVPPHVRRRIAALKADAVQLRRDISRREQR